MVLTGDDASSSRSVLIAFIAEPAVARKILDHLDLDSTGPPTAHRRHGHGDQVEPVPAHEVADPVYEDA